MVATYHLHAMRTTISGFLLLGCAHALHHSWLQMTTITRVSVTLDPNFAPVGAKFLHDALMYELKQHHTSAVLFTSLCKKFTCIDTIEAHLHAPGQIHYTITARLPRFAINKNLVLCDNDQLVPCSWYQQALYEQLPEITTAQQMIAGTAPAGLSFLAHRLSRKILDQYTVHWHDAIETKLTSKKDMLFTISCNADCIGYAQIGACEKIYTDIKIASPSKNNTGALHADVRFANQIVIHAEQGRLIHG